MPKEKKTQLSKQPQEQHLPLEAVQDLVRSELNLEHNAIFTTSSCNLRSREIIFRETNNQGQIIERRVRIGKAVTGAEVGILNVYHFKVYLVLLELWEKAGRPIDRPVKFRVSDIIKRLGIVEAGDNYRVVRNLLLELRQIPVEFKDSFFDPKIGEFTSLRPFSVLSYLDFKECRYKMKKSQELKFYGYGEFQFDLHLIESLLANYAHPILLEVIKQFKKHQELAILLYIYIDRNLAFKNRYEVTLEKLFDHLDLSQRQIRYPADRKVKLAPVLKQLKGKPLSTGILVEAKIVKTEDGRDYKAIFVKEPRRTAWTAQGANSQPELPLGERPAKKPDKTLDEKLVSRLKKIGLTTGQIDELLKNYDHNKIREWLNALRFAKAKNRAAFLMTALREGYELPSAYLEHLEESGDKPCKNCKGSTKYFNSDGYCYKCWQELMNQ